MIDAAKEIPMTAITSIAIQATLITVSCRRMGRFDVPKSSVQSM
jgi:hypothetical protein